MTPESLNLQVVLILTMGFTLASIFGYITLKLNLSPILGYLLAGYVIGPYSPGYVADLHLAEQLAEVGVMLMMFGVGLHFKWQDLVKVKNIAIPGAIGQVFVTCMVSAYVMHHIGGSWASGVMMGIAIGVASTVVLVRVLSDQHILNTLQGHIAVGWLIVEDILTVAVLILLPTIVNLLTGVSVSGYDLLLSILIVFCKFIVLLIVMFTFGEKVISYSLFKIARTRSPELFILSVLAFIFLIATSASILFGTSIALGAFIAGMVIGQTDVRHQASAYASPMKDAFVVIFFLSVGMLFSPPAIIEHFPLFLGVLGIVLIVKPLIAFLIVVLLRYSVTTALTIAIALAQIGEFSFILAEEASKYGLFSDEGYDIVVACALISIAINPLLFKLLNYFKPYIDRRSDSSRNGQRIQQSSKRDYIAVVVGFGIIGQTVVNILEKKGFWPVIIDYNVDTVARLIQEKREAIYGEASFPNMLKMAHIESAKLLVVTIPDLAATLNIVKYARELHPDITVIARIRYSDDQNFLNQIGVKWICCEEEEVRQAFQRVLNQIHIEGMSQIEEEEIQEPQSDNLESFTS